MGMFDSPGEVVGFGDVDDKYDPFEDSEIIKQPMTVPKKEVVVAESAPEELDVDVEEDIPYIDIIDALPGVGKFKVPSHFTLKEKTEDRKLRLVQVNAEVKDFTDEIEAKRFREEDEGRFSSLDFRYDVQAVRLMGQTGCSLTEMAAYFNVAESTIMNLMKDPTSDYFQVYHRANSILCMTLRQSQIKTALAGDTKMQIHLGKHVLGQVDSGGSTRQSDDLSKSKDARRKRITTLTQTITEFDA